MESTATWGEDEGVKTKSVDNDLAKEAAEKFPNSGYDQIFKDIAREENVHKNHIKSILIDMGVTIDNSMCKLEGSAEEASQKF